MEGERLWLLGGGDARGLGELLRAIVERIHPPKGDPKAPFKALIFDSVFNSFRGIIAYYKVIDGEITAIGFPTVKASVPLASALRVAARVQLESGNAERALQRAADEPDRLAAEDRGGSIDERDRRAGLLSYLV